MPLPANWVERLFQKLSVTYGQSFLRQYDGVPLEDVKANWGHELACFQQNPAAISRGLDLLPTDRAPTVLQFRDLCRTSAQSEVLALAAPSTPADPAVIAAARKAMKPITNTGNKDWAHALKAREEQGPGLTQFQKACWRDALGEIKQPEAA